jgi:ubiquinone/menaquinone biosynthesis C-methylase UbiE
MDDMPMEPSEGPGMFHTSGDAYDLFMGRYSRPLARVFADAAGVARGDTVLDVGCGPGALTTVLAERLGASAVAAMDPSPPFVAECAARHPGVDVRTGRAEAIPFDDQAFDRAMTQLVLHFVEEPDAAAAELRRVVRPGGTVAACVWDFEHEMEMLRHFWDAALDVDPAAPDEARVLRFGRAGEITALFAAAGLDHLEEVTLEVTSEYAGFDELWSGFLLGIGPAGAYCLSLSDDGRAAVREGMFARVGAPAGSFTLSAMARCVTGTRPV